MITQFRVQNYKALRDVTLDLTPIHVLIGPNDSGKTSILEAIAALCRSVHVSIEKAFAGRWNGRDLVWKGLSTEDVYLTCDIHTKGKSISYCLTPRFFNDDQRNVMVVSEILTSESRNFVSKEFHRHSIVCKFNVAFPEDGINGLDTDVATDLINALQGVHYYRFDPSMLALPAAQDANRQFTMDRSGFSLPLVLDNILGEDRNNFNDLEIHFRQIFPEIESIKLRPEPGFFAALDNSQVVPELKRADGKGLYFSFKDHELPIPASQVSDGVLLVLAYLAILYLPKPPRVLLIEEPENGIHPQRLREVLRILRDIVKKQSYTQVILTTHSPYAVDEFKPEEVTVCIKQDDGSVAVKRLSDSKAVADQKDIFTLGEIWTAEGDEALVKPETVSEENAG
ncbi:recombination protein F [Symmachiella dynata]|uniref:AAA family ATPase n=1 Tax=Symmachiella dynata TaxID=2527995 RepID=UPI00118AD001|nr:ATP-binding protein [Symmachiella dynata]QDT47332.1 recombination protein F [Symmachiella dynata]